MSVTVASVTADLVAEQDTLDPIVAALSADEWNMATPSPRWSVRDQISHLTFFDQAAALAINDPERFAAHRAQFVQALVSDPGAADEVTLGPTRSIDTGELLAQWRLGRAELAAATTGCAEDARVEWYGPSMGAKSFLTARLMECWAHGQDVCDTVGATREPTERLRHIAQLGVITRGWTYINRKSEIPPGEVLVTLTSPSGNEWTWWPRSNPDGSVVGPALDFCLVTAQRRNVADTSLIVTGDIAVDWMNKAQLFAGPPSEPPGPRG